MSNSKEVASRIPEEVLTIMAQLAEVQGKVVNMPKLAVSELDLVYDSPYGRIRCDVRGYVGELKRRERNLGKSSILIDTSIPYVTYQPDILGESKDKITLRIDQPIPAGEVPNVHTETMIIHLITVEGRKMNYEAYVFDGDEADWRNPNNTTEFRKPVKLIENACIASIPQLADTATWISNHKAYIVSKVYGDVKKEATPFSEKTILNEETPLSQVKWEPVYPNFYIPVIKNGLYAGVSNAYADIELAIGEPEDDIDTLIGSGLIAILSFSHNSAEGISEYSAIKTLKKSACPLGLTEELADKYLAELKSLIRLKTVADYKAYCKKRGYIDYDEYFKLGKNV